MTIYNRVLRAKSTKTAQTTTAGPLTAVTVTVTTAVTEQNTVSKSFIGNLSKLRNINSSIIEQQETLENTRKETIELSKQKQDLSTQCQTAVKFIGLDTKQIHHFNWLIDYYYNNVTKKIMASSPTISPLLINLVYVNLGNQHRDDRAEEGKR